MLSWEVFLKHADWMGMLKVKRRETGFVHSAREFLQRMAVNVFSSIGYILANLGDSSSFFWLQAEKKKCSLKQLKSKEQCVIFGLVGMVFIVLCISPLLYSLTWWHFLTPAVIFTCYYNVVFCASMHAHTCAWEREKEIITKQLLIFLTVVWLKLMCIIHNCYCICLLCPVSCWFSSNIWQNPEQMKHWSASGW